MIAKKDTWPGKLEAILEQQEIPKEAGIETIRALEDW
jgi:hypothetical protein